MFHLPAHGEHKIWIEKNFICIRSTGPWNLEYFEMMHKEFKHHILPIAQQPFGVLLTVIGNAIPIQEGLKLHLDFVRKGSAKCIAINLLECETKAITKKLFSDVYNKAKLPCEFFENEQMAKNWLINYLPS